ncbi:MAG: hemin uptake protein HemP [Pirellulaceae bacterium]|nr:hemin uptake protein HemP [Pirellulaceae bacterium]
MSTDNPSNPEGSESVGRPAPLAAETRPQGASRPASLSVPYFKFEELFGDAQRVSIQLGDQVYELRRTRAGKLVLNK